MHAHGGPRKRRHRNAGDRRNGPHEFDDPDGETRVVDLLEGKAMQLSLGWVVFPPGQIQDPGVTDPSSRDGDCESKPASVVKAPGENQRSRPRRNPHRLSLPITHTPYRAASAPGSKTNTAPRRGLGFEIGTFNSHAALGDNEETIAIVDEDLAHGAIAHGFILKALSLACPDGWMPVCVAACSLQAVGSHG